MSDQNITSNNQQGWLILVLLSVNIFNVINLFVYSFNRKIKKKFQENDKIYAN